MQRIRTSPAWPVLLFFLLAPGLADSALVGDFEGLQPGVSRKADADRVLGTPVREVIPGERYDYDPTRHDSRRISIRYDRDTQVIRTIDIYLKTQYPKDRYQEWFKLGTPVRTEFDANGNLVEHYSPEGLALHYAGPEDKSAVEFFSHFDPRMLAQASQSAPALQAEPQPAVQAQPSPPAAQRPSVELAAGPNLRIGLLIGAYDGQGLKIVDVALSSPASRAGLRAGDVILEFGDSGLYDTQIAPARLSLLLAGQSPGQPVRLLVQRGADRFETAVTPEERAAFDPRQTELAKSAYDQGRKLMDAGDFAGAAGYFNQTISHDPGQPAGYAGLAESHYRRGNKAHEIDALKRGVAAAPGYRLYSLLGFACRWADRCDEAIDAFGKAFALMPADVKDTAMLEQFGFCYMRKRRYQEALSPLEAAYKINPRSPASVYLLGGCHDSLDNRDQAMQFYRSYLSLGDKNPEWTKYARRRLDALAKGPQEKGSAVEQLLKLLEVIVKETTRPQQP